MKRLTYLGALLALKIFARLPRPVAYALAHALVILYYRCDGRHRRIGMTNLLIAFPEQPKSWRAEVLRRSYLNLADLLVEVSRFPKITPQNIAQLVSYTEGSMDRYVAAKSKGCGLLYLTAHVGAWELLPFAHAAYGYPLSFVVRPINREDLNEVLERYRKIAGNQLIPKKNAIRSILRVLNERGDVGILIDQNVLPEDGVFAALFGKLACTTNGLAMIALRTGAPVLPAFLLPGERRGRYRIHFGEEVPLHHNGTVEENIRLTTERFNQVLEDVIRKYPHCWLWVHKRWKTRPPGDEENIYP
ncbi:MAG TPA: lysophospholipid acyltransferase family protein [Acidobacteriota bacterium]|jgi:KDO2-lipid IV(A) lauroyltransferase